MKPEKKLAESLQALQTLQEREIHAIRSSDLSRTHRERLVRFGFLVPVMKGWYLPGHPEFSPGDTSLWYTSFWQFCAEYLSHRFGINWSLSPEQSILLHVSNWTVPKQLIVRSPKARNNSTELMHDTSIFELRSKVPDEHDAVEVCGMKTMSLASALCKVGPSYFQNHNCEAQAALFSLKDSSELLQVLLKGDHSTVAGRIAAALRSIGRKQMADDIVASMRAAGYSIQENNPFEKSDISPGLDPNVLPSVNRLRSMWGTMRKQVAEVFPRGPGLPADHQHYLEQIEESYTQDAYHSLSIEGFHVTKDLVNRVQSGDWNPESNSSDISLKDALAARGYWLAFQSVKKSISRIFEGENPGKVVSEDHRDWYRQLFSPSVQSGILSPQDLAGYRRGQVYIKGSMHIPPRKHLVVDLMQELFRLLSEETNSGVRAVLGHFFFVYIHPYVDGNGRTGRFLMNVMMASGGYSWTIVRIESRSEYMSALEHASVNNDIRPLAEFLKRHTCSPKGSK